MEFARENLAFPGWVLIYYDTTPAFGMKNSLNVVLIGHSLQWGPRENMNVDIKESMVCLASVDSTLLS